MELTDAPGLPLVVGLPFLLFFVSIATCVGIFWVMRKVRRP